MCQGSLKKLGAYINRLDYKGLLDCKVYRKHKTKRQNDYQWDYFSDFFKKTNMEEELASVIGKNSRLFVLDKGYWTF